MNEIKPFLSHYQFADGRLVLFNTYCRPPGSAPAFGIHLPPEVGVVLAGSVDRYAGGVCHKLTRGGFWVSSMLEPHGTRQVCPDTLSAVFILRPDFLFNVHVPGVDSRIWLRPFNTPAAARPCLVDERFAGLAERLVAALTAAPCPELRPALIQTALLEVLLLAVSLGKYRSAVPGEGVDAFAQLCPAIELVHSSRRPVATAAAARLCKLSPPQFARLFVRATGVPFARYSLRCRLEQVAHELTASDMRLDELAWKWGFTDKSHLAHRFQEYYHVTPGAYRQRASQSCV